MDPLLSAGLTTTLQIPKSLIVLVLEVEEVVLWGSGDLVALELLEFDLVGQATLGIGPNMTGAALGVPLIPPLVIFIPLLNHAGCNRIIKMLYIFISLPHFSIRCP